MSVISFCRFSTSSCIALLSALTPTRTRADAQPSARSRSKSADRLGKTLWLERKNILPLFKK